MSHYTVLVITKDGDYEKALAPFDENLEVEPYICKTREEIIQEAQDDHDKAYFGTKDQRDYYAKKWANISPSSKHAILEQYRKYFDDCKFDEDGNQLSSYNPNSKWDWYALGGRWINTLKLKEKVAPIAESKPSLIQFELPEDGYTDHAQVKDIDFTPSKQDIKDAERFWEVVVEKQPLRPDEKEEDFFSFWKPEYYLDKYGTKEEYVKCQTELFTYALLYDGEWIEPGEMGWWGMENSTKDSNEWYRERFREIIASLSPEDYISVIDCHI